MVITFFFLGGKAPADRQSVYKRLKTMTLTMFVLACIVSALGICLAFLFLCFNVRNRHKRYVKQNNAHGLTTSYRRWKNILPVLHISSFHKQCHVHGISPVGK